MRRIQVRCLYVGYSEHKFARIPMAAAHINTSSVGVQYALMPAVSVWVCFRQPV